MTIDQNLSKKILVFRFVAPSSSMIVVDYVGNFQTESFDTTLLPYPNCTFIHYEPATELYQIRFGEGPLTLMTEEQKTKMKQFIETLPRHLNLHFPCYDPNKSNLYQGVVALLEAEKNGYIPVLEDCHYAVAKYDVDNNKWVAIKAIITDSGSLLLDPGAYCNQCVLFLTDDEWADFPKYDSSNASAIWRWDFESQEWIDVRPSSEYLDIYKMLVASSLQNVERAKYEKEGIDYFGVIHNPVLMRLVNEDNPLTHLNATDAAWKSNIAGILDSIKSEISVDLIKVQNEEDLVSSFVSEMTDELTKLQSLLRQSYASQFLIRYWQDLPVKTVGLTDLTKSHIESFTTMFQDWLTKTYEV